VSQRLAGSGFREARFIQRETVFSEISRPIIRSSPWMRELPSWVLHHLEDQIPKTPEQGAATSVWCATSLNLTDLAAFIAKIAILPFSFLAPPPNSMV